MKKFNFEIKWLPNNSPLITILIILTYFSISINGQCTNFVLQPSDHTTFVAKSQSCLRLVCEQNNIKTA